ncbi:MAG: hypothetical protein R6U96_04860 [Promethearchaeia archaeon]
MPLNYYVIVVVGGLALFFFIFAMVKKETLDEKAYNKRLTSGFDKSLDKSVLDTHNFTPKQELKRKLFHLSAILYIFTWVLQPLIFFGVRILYEGIINTPTYENYYNIQILFSESVEGLLLNGLIIQFFMLLCIFIGNANAEVMRLRFNNYGFPLKKTLATTRRSTEVYDTSGSMLLLMGLAMSSLILTYGSQDRIAGVYAQMAIISISVFSDMFAALIGRKWGKHKWPIVEGKSFEGSIAGCVVGFISAIFFVGWFLALIGILIFVFTDIVLAKVEISDNASNPILMAIIFKLLIDFVNPMITLLPYIKIW